MSNALPLKAAAWTISAAVWAVLLAAAFSMGMKLPEVRLPPGEDEPLTVVTRPAPPVIQVTQQAHIRPSVEDDPVVIATLPPIIESGPVIATTTVDAVSGPLVAPPPRITDPRWLSRPGAREFERFYPARARERGQEGRVTLDCRVRANGAIGCTVANETPSGWGFGAAALKIAPSFRLAPRLEDGRPSEGGMVRVDIAFRLDR